MMVLPLLTGHRKMESGNFNSLSGVLETFLADEVGTPVDLFEGHADAVKEFMWRGGSGELNRFRFVKGC